jgi:hypothetical protein
MKLGLLASLCKLLVVRGRLEHDHSERGDLCLVDVLYSLIDILLGCHVPGGASVINDAFSLRKESFVT